MSYDPDIVSKKYVKESEKMLCRLCLHADDFQVEIFGEDGIEKKIPYKIQSCFPIKVSKDDHFPKTVCYECLSKLNMMFDFVRKVLLTERVMTRDYAARRLPQDTNVQKSKINVDPDVTAANISKSIDNKTTVSPVNTKSSQNKRSVSLDVNETDGGKPKPPVVKRIIEEPADVEKATHVIHQCKKHKHNQCQTKIRKVPSPSPAEVESPKTNVVHEKQLRNALFPNISKIRKVPSPSPSDRESPKANVVHEKQLTKNQYETHAVVKVKTSSPLMKNNRHEQKKE